MMHYGSYGMMGGYSWIFQLVILLLFFLVIWWVLKNSSQFGFKSQESAKEILDKRLARGEISKKEYETLKKEIEG